MQPSRLISLLLLLLTGNSLLGQTPALTPELPPAQFGVRANWGFDFVSKNRVNLQEYAFLNTGQHLGFGGFLNIFAEPNVQFSPFLGMNFVNFPKSREYNQDCTQDTFPTFWSIYDSVPGRSHRFWNVALEPSFKFFIPKMKIHIRIFPLLQYNLRARVENYTHTCGAAFGRQWLSWEDDEYRKLARFTVDLGGSLVKEVKIGPNSYLQLESGYKVMLPPLLKVSDPDPDRPGFTLYPGGWFFNLGFFRG